MRRQYAWSAMLLTVVLATGAFAQSTVGTLTGIVTDTSKAALPGVSVKVLNEDTGQSQSMLTNDSGSYSFIVAPGSNYTLSAEYTGFKRVTVNKITLRMQDTSRVDIALEIGNVVTNVIVDATKTDPLLKDPTIGITLGETEIMNLPLVGNDPLSLITTLPGYRANPLGHEYDTVGGLPMTMINTVRDGLSVTDGFSPGGVGSTTILNSDMISEIRLILSPVDAEAGRGNGQVQITTKSGTNRFQWNINYNLRQNALNSLGPSPNRIKQPFTAAFQYIVSVGGPIIKNRTFYFVNWDQQLTWRRPFSQQAACPNNGITPCSNGGYTVVPALTDPARNGVFRYFDGWNLVTANSLFGENPAAGTVTTPGDPNGLAVAPNTWAGTGEPYDGNLKCFSVFGMVKFDNTPFTAADCGVFYRRVGGVPDMGNPLPAEAVFPTIPDPITGDLNWDGHGRVPDRTGYIQRLIGYMPRANYFTANTLTGGLVNSFGTDPLNRAAASFILETQGLANRNTFTGGTFGIGLAQDQSSVDHKTINLKIDHNINSQHRVTLSTSFQRDSNQRTAAFSRWPKPNCADLYNASDPCRGGVNGYAERVPHVLTLNGLSTFSPTLVNEARFGITYNRSAQLPPWDGAANPADADFAKSFLQTGWASAISGETTPVYYTPGVGTNGVGGGAMDFSSNILPSGLNSGTGGGGFFGSAASQGCLNALSVNSSSCETGSALYNFADTVSWNRGSHSIRAGAEVRLTRAHELLSSVIPSATAGTLAVNAARLATACSPTNCPEVSTPELPISEVVGSRFTGLMATSRANARDLLYMMSGSVLTVSQQFWVNSVDNYRNGKWDTWDGNYCPTDTDLTKFCPGNGNQIRKTVQDEFAIFVKDDWKIGKRLTLNLGVRYEEYGKLYTKGFATGVLDQGYGLFGTSRQRNRGGNPFDYWMTPGNLYITGYGSAAPAIDVTGQFLPNGEPSYIPGVTSAGSKTVAAGNSNAQVICVYGIQQNPLLPASNCDPTLLTTRVFVGPDSRPHGDPNAPDYTNVPSTYRDRNNIGPAIGFSYRLPVGARTFLIRGGFQFTYGSAGRDRSFATGTGGQVTQTLGGSSLSGGVDQLTVSCGATAGTACRFPAELDRNPLQAFMLSDLPNITPLAPTANQVPSLGGILGQVTGANTLRVQQFHNPTFNTQAYDPHYQDPRTENYTLSVSTNLSRSSTIAITYVGTLGRNRPTTVDINTPNVYHNPELKQALDETRRGLDSPLFDAMLAGLNLTGLNSTAGYGNIGTCVPFASAPTVNSGGNPDGTGNYCGPGFVYQSGSAHIRRNALLQTNLANGNYNAVMVTLLANSSGNGGIFPGGTTSFGTNNGFIGGNLPRNGCDRIASPNGATPQTQNRSVIRGNVTTGNNNGATGGNPNLVRCFPEDYSRTNENIDQVAYNNNWGFTNYHQLQFQYTVRMPSGVNLQATYLTSKTLALPRDFYKTSTYGFGPASGGAFTGNNVSIPPITGFSDPQTEESRRKDYGLSSDSLKHSVRLNGILQLPVGPGKALLGKSSGILAQLLGGWQLSVIYNAQSGQPFSILAGDMLYGVSSGTAVASNLSTGGGCNAYAGTAFSPTAGTGQNCQSGLSFPDVVSTLWQTPQGKLQKNGPDGNTTYFGNPSPFALIRDPQCTSGSYVGRNNYTDPGSFNLAAACNLQALVMKVPAGTPGAFPLGPALSVPTTDQTPVLIMLQNPLPGKQGSLGAQTMRQPARFYLDASLSKNFMFTERRGVQLRVDATNVLNHPQPVDMYFSLGPGGTFNDQSNGTLQSLANGCYNQFGANTVGNGTATGLQNGLANCGRQVQVSFRMINN